MKVSVSLGCCANNIHSLMGTVNMTFCFHFTMRVSIVIILNGVIMPLIAVVGMLRNQLCGSGQQGCATGFTSMNSCCATTDWQECSFSKPRYLYHTYSAWCNTESVLSASWILTVSLLCASISQVGSCSAGAVFVLYELTTDPADHKSCWQRSERVEQTSIMWGGSTF